MNIFVWNIAINSEEIDDKDFEFDFVENDTGNWTKVIYVFWETELETSKDILKMLEEKFWAIESYDISISSEDKIELLPFDYEEGIYEIASFEWAKVTYEEIRERFLESDVVFSIREAEYSEKFWNKIIKVDFVY